MLLTTVPAALECGARLFVNTSAQRLFVEGGRVVGLEAVHTTPKDMGNGDVAVSSPVLIRANHFVVAGGAINSPALLMRSGVPDPHSLLGRRTFLHPVVMSAAVFEQRVDGWSGAPQTIYTDHFLGVHPIDGPMGYKLEAPPIHPVIFASSIPGWGESQAQMLRQFPHHHILLGLLRDGFAPGSPGGTVGLRGDGSPTLDYPLNGFVMEGARRALLSMAEIQFAAGARHVLPVHEQAFPLTSWPQAREVIGNLPMLPLQTRVVSAHVMGGCGMAGNAQQGVTRPDGVHWQLPNLSIHDGSLFPTSIGANPQLSIYGLVNMLTQRLIQRMGRTPQALA
jgi:hypothetical protein